MSATSVKLLQAACEVLGSEATLAERLGIDPLLLEAYLADRRELPDRLLLATVDLILTDRTTRLNLRSEADLLQNTRREGGATATTGTA